MSRRRVLESTLERGHYLLRRSDINHVTKTRSSIYSNLRRISVFSSSTMVSSDLGSDTEALKLETAEHNEHFPPSGTSNMKEDQHTTGEASKYTARLRGLADHVQDAGMPFLSFSRFHVMQILHLQNEIIKTHRASPAGNEEVEEVARLDMPQLGEMTDLYSEATIPPPRTTHPTKTLVPI